MDEVVRKLNLSDDVKDALTGRQGGLGRLLHLAELLEQLDFRHLGMHLDEMGITFDDVLLSQRRAFTWHRGMV